MIVLFLLTYDTQLSYIFLFSMNFLNCSNFFLVCHFIFYFDLKLDIIFPQIYVGFFIRLYKLFSLCLFVLQSLVYTCVLSILRYIQFTNVLSHSLHKLGINRYVRINGFCFSKTTCNYIYISIHFGLIYFYLQFLLYVKLKYLII